MAPNRRTRKGRGADATGRSKKDGRFLKLEHYLLQSAAWKALYPVRRAIYIELAQRYNGSNNGEISMSVREAASSVHCSKDTASAVFHELEHMGFIHRNLCGSFDWKQRQATTWILTQHPFKNHLATKDFMKWKAVNVKPGPKQRNKCPDKRTEHIKNETFSIIAVPYTGPKH